nr:SipW-dependent-type signal peptide-containing protein [Halopenitus persicus]
MRRMRKKNTIGLSRRRVLASMGAIGVASAGAGLGTTAYFSDEESFEGNSLAAGELDLKVDWQQTYDGPIPTGENAGQVKEHAVNAYPDTSGDNDYGDGLQDLNGVHYSGAGEIDPVFNAAEVPACCDCGDDEYYVTYGGESYCIEPLTGDDPIEAYENETGVRSENEDIQGESRSTVFLWKDAPDDEDGNIYLFIVQDAKDTETGGTASYVIEGAPNAQWESGSWIVEDDDGASTDDEYMENGVAEGHWVWEGANTDGGVFGPVNNDDGTLGDFALRLTPELNQKAGLYDEFANGDYDDWFDGSWSPLTRLVVLDGSASNVITLEEGIEDSGEGVEDVTIHSSCGIDSGVELETPAVFRSENYPEQEHLVQFDDVKPGDNGEITFSLHLCDNPGYVWMTAANFSENGGTLTEPEIDAILDNAGNDGPTTVDEVEDSGHLADHVEVTVWYDEDCDNVYDEEVEEAIFEGTLRDLMENTFELEDDEDEGMVQLGEDCYPARAGFCIGFEWWVPTEVGNIIQGDEAHFDLGFYTEQCRHNEDPGNTVDGNNTANDTANGTVNGTENGTPQPS